jgi:ribosomal protein L9
MAIPATPANLKNAETRRKASEEDRAMRTKMVADRLAQLAEGKLVIKKKANEQGHLYDAVGAAEISAVAQIPEDAIRLEKPIKEVGTHEVPVAFGEDFGKVSVTVEAE